LNYDKGEVWEEEIGFHRACKHENSRLSSKPNHQRIFRFVYSSRHTAGFFCIIFPLLTVAEKRAAFSMVSDDGMDFVLSFNPIEGQ